MLKLEDRLWKLEIQQSIHRRGWGDGGHREGTEVTCRIRKKEVHTSCCVLIDRGRPNTEEGDPCRPSN